MCISRGWLQCVAVCCSVLQCVAVCCSVLQCVAVCKDSNAVPGKPCAYREVGCSVLQCVAVCCSVLQYVKIAMQYQVNHMHIERLVFNAYWPLSSRLLGSFSSCVF